MQHVSCSPHIYHRLIKRIIRLIKNYDDVSSDSKVLQIEPPIATKVNLTSQAISDDKLSSNKSNIFSFTNDTAVTKINTSTVTVDSFD